MQRASIYFFPALAFTVILSCNPGGRKSQGNSDEGKPLSQLKQLKREVVSFPDSIDLRAQLIYALREEGETELALKQLDTLLLKDSTGGGNYAFQAELYLDLKDSASATRSFEKAVQLSPDPDYLYSLAYLYAAAGDKRSLVLCDGMIAKMTKQNLTGDPYYIKSIYYRKTGDHQKALSLLNQCIRVDHTLREAYIEKGNILYEQKKYQDALEVFRLASTVSNAFADAYYWQAKCFAALGDKPNAVANYKKAIGLDNNFADAKEELNDLENKQP